MIIQLENASIEQIIECARKMNSKRIHILNKTIISKIDIKYILKDMHRLGYNALIIKDTCIMPCACTICKKIEIEFPF